MAKKRFQATRKKCEKNKAEKCVKGKKKNSQ